MKIYDIERVIEEILNRFEVDPDGVLIDTATGEILDEEESQKVFGELEQLNMEKNVKLENLACWIKEMKASAEAIKAEEKKLKERRESLERKSDRITRFLEAQLAGEKLESPRVKVSYKTTSKVNIINEGAIREEFIREKIVREPDKVAIKQALKDGIEVLGAELVESKSMSIK